MDTSAYVFTPTKHSLCCYTSRLTPCNKAATWSLCHKAISHLCYLQHVNINIHLTGYEVWVQAAENHIRCTEGFIKQTIIEDYLL